MSTRRAPVLLGRPCVKSCSHGGRSVGTTARSFGKGGRREREQQTSPSGRPRLREWWNSRQDWDEGQKQCDDDDDGDRPAAGQLPDGQRRSGAGASSDAGQTVGPDGRVVECGPSAVGVGPCGDACDTTSGARDNSSRWWWWPGRSSWYSDDDGRSFPDSQYAFWSRARDDVASADR